VSRRSDREERNGEAERSLGAVPSDRPPLRRGLFGYRTDDVDEAFEARDTELAELRQDVAALWLAFSQHDRLIRAALEMPASSPPTAPPEAPAPAPAPAGPAVEAPAPIQATPVAPAGAAGAAPVNQQLEELDQVLAAIESATQTLERTYADETGAVQQDGPGGSAAGGDEAATH
jgi:hypothetical protein